MINFVEYCFNLYVTNSALLFKDYEKLLSSIAASRNYLIGFTIMETKPQPSTVIKKIKECYENLRAFVNPLIQILRDPKVAVPTLPHALQGVIDKSFRIDDICEECFDFKNEEFERNMVSQLNSSMLNAESMVKANTQGRDLEAVKSFMRTRDVLMDRYRSMIFGRDIDCTTKAIGDLLLNDILVIADNTSVAQRVSSVFLQYLNEYVLLKKEILSEKEVFTERSDELESQNSILLREIETLKFSLEEKDRTTGKLTEQELAELVQKNAELTFQLEESNSEITKLQLKIVHMDNELNNTLLMNTKYSDDFSEFQFALSNASSSGHLIELLGKCSVENQFATIFGSHIVGFFNSDPVQTCDTCILSLRKNSEDFTKMMSMESQIVKLNEQVNDIQRLAQSFYNSALNYGTYFEEIKKSLDELEKGQLNSARKYEQVVTEEIVDRNNLAKQLDIREKPVISPSFVPSSAPVKMIVSYADAVKKNIEVLRVNGIRNNDTIVRPTPVGSINSHFSSVARDYDKKKRNLDSLAIAVDKRKRAKNKVSGASDLGLRCGIVSLKDIKERTHDMTTNVCSAYDDGVTVFLERRKFQGTSAIGLKFSSVRDGDVFFIDKRNRNLSGYDRDITSQIMNHGAMFNQWFITFDAFDFKKNQIIKLCNTPCSGLCDKDTFIPLEVVCEQNKVEFNRDDCFGVRYTCDPKRHMESGRSISVGILITMTKDLKKKQFLIYAPYSRNRQETRAKDNRVNIISFNDDLSSSRQVEDQLQMISSEDEEYNDNG